MIPAPTYCGMPLDRRSALRDDPKWIRAQLDSLHTQIVFVWRDRNLFRKQGDESVACFMHKREVDEIVLHESMELIYLGHGNNDAPIFVADLTHLEEAHAKQLIAATDTQAEFMDLRAVGATINGDEAATMAFARGIAYWHRQNKFCGRCGNATISFRGGHMRRCVHEVCARENFPRIDPAVIMLVEQSQDGVARCLLGRHRDLPKGVYSTLAGYVDPGESLEEAVVREVMEETGIAVQKTTYLASQPWPFPASLMVGFHAQTNQQKITIAANELEDAKWFTAR